MKLSLDPRRNVRALSLLGAIIIFACVIVLGGLIMKILLKAIEKMPPLTHPSTYDTNIVGVVAVNPAIYERVPALKTLQMPEFTWSEQDLSQLDPQAILNHGDIVIERSTNLVDWTPTWRIKDMNNFNLADDTNQAPWAFYRAVIMQ